MTAHPAPDLDAALVLGMASTAIPFARSPEEQAERWLRILRLHGEAGSALQALGVSEAPLERLADEHGAAGAAGAGNGSPRHGHGSAAGVEGSATGTPDEVLAAVHDRAVERAALRGARAVASADVLRAVMDFYGPDFDHVLRAHGTDRDEVLARLDLQAA
jgi:hypothetical protein